MTRRAAFTKAAIKRVVEGVIEGGLPVGSFQVVVEEGRLTILPVRATEPPAVEDDDGWDEAFNKWRHSA